MNHYSNSLLDQLRTTNDPIADAAVEAIFQSKNVQAIREKIASIKENNQRLPKGLPKPVGDFFRKTKTLPQWTDEKQLQLGAKFFDKYVEKIMSLLGTLALPYCYAAANGAEVIYLSERIRKDTSKRLGETALFVFDVLSKGAFEPEGLGIRSIQKVRLMHATVRYHILKHYNWDEKTLGSPINQEDMLGTNLAFSLITLRGLRKIGCNISQKEFEAYLHTWRVVGFMLGIQEDCLPTNAKEAFIAEKNIRQRQFKPSEAGTKLTEALLNHFDSIPEIQKLPQGYLKSYIRFVLGDQTSDMLGVPSADWTNGLVTSMRFANIFQTNFGINLPSISPPSKGSAFLRGEMLKQLDGQYDFQIPLALR